MVLSDRKTKILEAIINDYITTAEPIGSRTIAKKYSLGISSATVRNEMSDLEEMGLIIQPHASAGRIPSDKGYRLYVDRLMHQREAPADISNFLNDLILNNVEQIDYLMRETAKAISLMTKYTTIVSEPQANKTKIKHIQLMPLDESSIVLILITDSKMVKNHTIKIEKPLNYGQLNNFTTHFNEVLEGASLEDINENTIRVLSGKLSQDSDILIPVVTAVKNLIKQQDDVQIYTGGVNNILAFPEFSNLEKAKAIFETLEEREILISLLGKDSRDNIQIVIGSENSLEQMRDCSIIKANYMLENKTFGSIGIIGPTRMDYSQVISILNAVVKNINGVLKTLAGGYG